MWGETLCAFIKPIENKSKTLLFKIHDHQGGKDPEPINEGDHLLAEVLPRIRRVLQDLLLVLGHRPEPRPALPDRGHGPADGRFAGVISSFLQLRSLTLQGHDFLMEGVNP